jgi:hypothetical protein
MAKLEYAEVDAQPYEDARFSSGLVYGHPVDEVYLKFEREGEEPTTIVLRRDEAVRVAALLANAVWSLLTRKNMD